MKLQTLFEEKKVVFSLEIFPPKKTSSIQTIYDTLDALRDIEPDFISVTYGAGGNPADRSTVQIASDIKHRYHIEPLAHLSCVNSTKEHIGRKMTSKISWRCAATSIQTYRRRPITAMPAT